MIGDVVFFKRTDSLFSRLIASITNSEYTHVALIVDFNEKTNIVTIIESDRFVATRIRTIKLDELEGSYTLFTTGEKPKEQIDKIVKFAYNSIGKEYDYLQVFGLFLSLTFGGDRYGFFNSTNKLICSELIDLAYYTAGVKRKTTVNIGNVTPRELLEVYDFKKV